MHIEFLSLGAGVQSTAIGLAAVEGLLPKPDVALFADTGWEPAQVYQHAGRLFPVLEAAGIRVEVVSKGNIRRDLIDPETRFSTIPYFIKQPCSMCDATGRVDSLVLGEAYEDQRAIGRLRNWLGLPRDADLADFRPWTGQCPQCNGTGVTQGVGRRQCTSEYKTEPIRRRLRELLGASPPDFRRVPKGNDARQWIGFSTDEIHRVNDRDDVSYLTRWHPLIDELDWSRRDCIRWLAGRSAPDGTPWHLSVTKSACIGCPYHGNAVWRRMRDERPDEFADAVAFDEGIRRGARGGVRDLSLRGEAFLHRSMLPLAQAPIDRVERKENRAAQTDIFDAIADAEAGYDPDEDGDPDGCSPFGCRSGAPVVEVEAS